MAKTDLEIAQECVMEPIEKVAAKIGIPADSLEHYGKYKAKLSFDYLKSIENNPHGKLVLVTAINPLRLEKKVRQLLVRVCFKSFR